MKRRQVKPAPSAGIDPASSLTASIAGDSGAAIPLPKSHIRRTPSEIQMADEVRRAEHDDVRMYARLVVGMQSQIQRDYATNGGMIHPLSKKSLQGVVRTKAANDAELKRLDDENQDDWETLNFEDDDEGDDSLASPWSTQVLLPPTKSNSDGSLSTRGSMKNRKEREEDDCVFSLEL